MEMRNELTQSISSKSKIREKKITLTKLIHKENAENKVSDNMLKNAGRKFPIQPPTSKEGYHYRGIFEEMFPSKEAALTVEAGPSIACSSPVAFRWSKEFETMNDPSGRSIGVHNQSVKDKYHSLSIRGDDNSVYDSRRQIFGLFILFKGEAYGEKSKGIVCVKRKWI